MNSVEYSNQCNMLEATNNFFFFYNEWFLLHIMFPNRTRIKMCHCKNVLVKSVLYITNYFK